MVEGIVVWFTGLPSSGKTTIAKLLEAELQSLGLKVELLDGDEVRKLLSSELGFSKEEREIHVKRVTYISNLLSKNGVITIVSIISPYKSFREHSRKQLKNFVEVWVKCSVETCRKRDPKGLYKKAEEGKLLNLTGVQDPYESPSNAEIVIDTENTKPKECVQQIMQYLIHKYEPFISRN